MVRQWLLHYSFFLLCQWTVLGKILIFISCCLWKKIVDWRFAFSCRRWPLAVAMVSSKCFFTRDSVSPGHDQKLPFLIAWIKVDSLGLKQEACKYWTNSRFVLLLVIITFAVWCSFLCDLLTFLGEIILLGFEIGRSHKPSLCFLWPTCSIWLF